MKVYQHIQEFKAADFTVVTTGTFDGVHLGHQRIIQRLNQIARENNGQSVLLTFDPHPRLVLRPEETDLKLLSSRAEKIELLEKYGIQHLIIHPFSRAFAQTTSQDFIQQILTQQFKTKKLVIGYDHHFGRNREGSFEHLKQYGPQYGFEVEEIPAQDVDQVEVSSTRIRQALFKGDMHTANAYLGHYYSLYGQVTRGQQLGRTIGFPTANLIPDEPLKLIPADGVYAVLVDIQGAIFKGMLNIGKRPTVNGTNRTIEVNIFNFNQDIYGTLLKIYFIDRLRNEVKFSSLDDLKSQLANDQRKAVQVLEKL